MQVQEHPSKLDEYRKLSNKC